MFKWLSRISWGSWKQSGPLLPYIEEFRETCLAWRADKLTSAEAHEAFLRLHKEVFNRAFVKKEIQSQSAYDFYNLAAEMANATSFDNKDKFIASIGLKLVENHLGAVYFNRLWRSLVDKRGPIASFHLFKCQVCKRIAPKAGSAEFVDIGFMFCARCGDLFEYSFWDVELSDAANQRQFTSFKSTYGEIHFRDCHCGGDLLTTARLEHPCVYCGAASTVFEIVSLQDIGTYQLTDYPEYIGMSSFQYLQSHKIHDLNGFVDRPARKARQYVEVDYSRSIAFPSSQLVSELASMRALLKKHNATHLVERLEECESALWEDYKLGIDLILGLYAGPDGLGLFSFAEADVSSHYAGSAHDLNKEFKKLRTSIYQTAKRISAEFRKLEQQSKTDNSA